MLNIEHGKLVKLNKKIKEYNYSSFLRHDMSFKINEIRKLGDFEFCISNKILYFCYVGNNAKFSFLNNDIYNINNHSSLIKDGKRFHAIAAVYDKNNDGFLNYWLDFPGLNFYVLNLYKNYNNMLNGIKNRNQQHQILCDWNSQKRNDFYAKQKLYEEDYDKIVKSEKIFNSFKKDLKKDKDNWNEIKNKCCLEVFNMSFDDLKAQEEAMQKVKKTEFVVKVSPMLRSLKQNCELLLKEVSEEGDIDPKTAKRFAESIKSFDKRYKNRTFLTKIKSLGSKGAKW